MYKEDRMTYLRTIWEDWEHSHDLFDKLANTMNCDDCPISSCCDSDEYLLVNCNTLFEMYARGEINGN